MPAKNSIKLNAENTYFHVYNRGVNKNEIFFDEKDYGFFLFLLKLYLVPPEQSLSLLRERLEHTFHRPKNFHNTIELVCFCLMPNHFHLIVKQKEKNALEHFMRALCIKYAMHINQKYSRVGYLFQGRYKGVLIDK